MADSLADAGFNKEGAKIGVRYEDALWAGSTALKFGKENLSFLHGEMREMVSSGSPWGIDEL
ncbi:MAG: hypothetical protein LBU25_10395 [Treponema sp.]|nr:hypothetical protein [Treponema sp.]